MGEAGYATSTVDLTWDYLNQACRHALRQQRIRRNPVQDVLLPEARPAKERKTLTIEQARRILFDAIPDDRNPAMWLTGLMCVLRPGELAGLR
jgi:integrase